jgi:4-hydroxy-3-polyprenylbenzoate decarboxylase
VIAAVGPTKRDLPTELRPNIHIPDGFSEPRVCLPGVLAIRGPAASGSVQPYGQALAGFCQRFDLNDVINDYPLVVIVDDSEFASRSIRNFLWVTFTRSNPAADLDGICASNQQKHWGCRGSLVIDARCKPHHAPELVEDPKVTKKVDAMATRGGPLAKWL